jgi:hypothetical protein
MITIYMELSVGVLKAGVYEEFDSYDMDIEDDVADLLEDHCDGTNNYSVLYLVIGVQKNEIAKFQKTKNSKEVRWFVE